MYNHPFQFEPLFPTKNLSELYIIAQQITAKSLSLKQALHPSIFDKLAALLWEMNSYYSNKIEGHSTHPVNIAKGLQRDFSDKPDIAKLQRLAVAHIEAEREIEAWVNGDETFTIYRASSIQRIHNALYEKLSASDRSVEKGYVVEPGKFRTKNVQVGAHIPPDYESIPLFLNRFEQFYSQSGSWDKKLVMIACAHQRLAWIHPFLDGNGRVVRLMTHAALYKDFTGGLWSICRGLARTQKEYYCYLAQADTNRSGNYDGRGNLSDEGLYQFCHYFLTIALDQVSFIANMLNLDDMKKRITALLNFRAQYDKDIRMEARLPLIYLFTSGPLTRAEFKTMTGLGDKVAQKLLSKLLRTELVTSKTKLGPVEFGIPLDALGFYFPNLYPEASMDNFEL